jgi:hypothetical protein
MCISFGDFRGVDYSPKQAQQVLKNLESIS